MHTDCTSTQLVFEGLGRRAVVGRFDGGRLTTDGGVLLLREVDRRFRVTSRLAACFRDHRDPRRIEHCLETLVAQRVFGLAAGYEDLNDHDRLRADSAFALASGCADVTGERRRRARDRGHALAGSSTLNRLELGVPEAAAQDRYQRIAADREAIDRLLVDLFLEAHAAPPAEIVLDLDATDDPLHGRQEGRFFHGYYGHYCYLPLYVTCGEHVLCARPISMRRRARWTNWRGSCRRSADAGPGPGSGCAAMPGSAARTSCAGARTPASSTCSGSRATPAWNRGSRRRCTSPGAGAPPPAGPRGGSGNAATAR